MNKIAVMGHGVVGSGVVEVFYKNHDSILTKAGADMDIKYILDLREFPETPYADKFIKDFKVIVKDPEVNIVVETMGGLEPAYTFVKQCLEAGKSVVSSNKELVAQKGFELLSIAKEKNVNFLFEASVGGGIPIIRPISQCLAANDITEIAGILNGTTNFILTKIFKDKMDFEKALSLAQSLGYAERDPSADVLGFDSCRKICILAALAFGKHVYPDQVHTEGITEITLADVLYAGSFCSAVKLIGRAKKLTDGRILATVYPAIVSRDSQLSSVDDVFNAVMVRGDATGDVVFYGKGAGKLPTASAVMADVIDCVKHVAARKYLSWDDYTEGYVADYTEDTLALYVCAETKTAEAKEHIKTKLSGVKFLARENQPESEIAFVTGIDSEKNLRQAMNELSDVITVKNTIRVLDI